MAVEHSPLTISQHFKMVLSAADALATKAREECGSDHLLLATSYQNGPLWRAVVRDMNIDALAFRSHIESFLDSHSQAQTAPPGPSGRVSHAETAVLGSAIAYAKLRGITPDLNVGTLLLALANEAGRVAEVLTSYGIDISSFRLTVERNLEREKDEL
jgi:ATP-dependent Clp protease ATP-binding subunit ClpA